MAKHQMIFPASVYLEETLKGHTSMYIWLESKRFDPGRGAFKVTIDHDKQIVKAEE